MGALDTETVTVDTSGSAVPLPKFDQTTRAPWIEAIARNLGTSYFGSPTQGGMMSQPIPIPMQQIAGLSPQEIQARNLAGGLGGFGGQLNEAQRMYRQGSRQFNPNEARPYMDQGARNLYGGSYGQADVGFGGGRGYVDPRASSYIGGGQGQFGGGFDDPSIRGMYGQSTQGFNPQSTQNYMNPYEDSVVQQTMRDIRESGAKSDIGRRGAEIGSGAFGGSRSRLQQGESDRSLNRGLMDAVGGIRSQGYQQAQQSAMGEFGRQQDARARAAQGMGQYGRQGQQIRQSAFEDARGRSLQGGQLYGSQGVQGRQIAQSAFEDAQRRRQQAASGMGGLSSDAFNQALNAYQTGTANQRAGAGGISGLGQQGFDMLSNQIGTLGNLGSIGRGIQQKGFDSQYTAAKQMADEPYMRLKRGQDLLGGIAPYGATIQQGYGSQQGSKGFYQDPSSFMKGLGGIGEFMALFS
tara:strand:- start:4969 stop:6363 length:1395 start_codon:yes stop_codon:yes gene_type:complete